MRRLPVAAWKYGTNGYGRHQQIYCQPNAKCILNPFSPKRICIQSIFPPHSTENYVGLWNIITSSAGNVYYPYGVRQSARDQTLEKHVCFCDFVTFVLRMCNSSHTAHHNKKNCQRILHSTAIGGCFETFPRSGFTGLRNAADSLCFTLMRIPVCRGANRHFVCVLQSPGFLWNENVLIFDLSWH